ncbi:hypothetical protein GQ54DRAFT_42795 [Martensiomyces pterosporus]|nr:hypothetical protein GQ54DRAFT_42795 [Martensiomyces pterosporus]
MCERERALERTVESRQHQAQGQEGGGCGVIGTRDETGCVNGARLVQKAPRALYKHTEHSNSSWRGLIGRLRGGCLLLGGGLSLGRLLLLGDLDSRVGRCLDLGCLLGGSGSLLLGSLGSSSGGGLLSLLLGLGLGEKRLQRREDAANLGLEKSRAALDALRDRVLGLGLLGGGSSLLLGGLGSLGSGGLLVLGWLSSSLLGGSRRSIFGSLGGSSSSGGLLSDSSLGSGLNNCLGGGGGGGSLDGSSDLLGSGGVLCLRHG